MKNKLFFLLLLIVYIYSIGIVHAMNLPLLGKVIYIDPGHGGVDPGAVYNGIYEETINLSISLKIQEELEKMGAIVYLTRYGDYDLSVKHTDNRKRSDLSRRVEIINTSKADLYFSIHLNADVSEKWSGAQVFYSNHLEENKTIAESLQEQLKVDLNTNRLSKEINEGYLYENVIVRGVLIEVGFLSNVEERNKLLNDDYQLQIAESISQFTVNYFQ